MPFSSLPNELLSQILSHASPSGTRYSCLLVNRRFYSLMLPIIYRDLQIPFINHNRLVTFIRTVRRNAFLGEHTRSICLGEDPFDTKRSVERIIGSNDINKLFPFLSKIELFAMTFERTMLYRFWAYCARAQCLGEVVLHYPDLVPLVQPIKGLKKLTWSFTGCEISPVLMLPEGLQETKWILRKWLNSLGKCTPNLEALVVGCVGREGTWGISDRIGLEIEEWSREAVVLPRLEKLREFEWREGEGIKPAAVWRDVAEGVLEEHKDQLERLRWEVAFCPDGAYTTVDQGPGFWDMLKALTNLKKLELVLYPGSPVPSQQIGGTGQVGWTTEHISAAMLKFLEGAADWDPKGLQEFKVRFSVIGPLLLAEHRLLGRLRNAKHLKTFEMTFGIPTFKNMEPPTNEGAKDFLYWYYDEAKMTQVIQSLPTVLRELLINFDGKHDVYDGYRQYEFGPMEDTIDKWDEDGSTRAQIRDLVNQRRSLSGSLLRSHMPGLEKAYIGGYNIAGSV
ncbi:hypothetical protein TWF730_011227 [Orbilia blumenaviensis]|uniref:F-box domain-containing protein n=1 Tax=Orbilia blumenaviensis TaxID=1796055 RepID=A0AAV9UK29_9PEZI